MRVNSPAPGGPACGDGGGVLRGSTGGGATGLWNILVNSPGSVDGAAAGRASGWGEVTCVVGAEAGGAAGSGAGGATGLWNILVNSPGSGDGVAAGRAGGMGGVNCVVAAEAVS